MVLMAAVLAIGGCGGGVGTEGTGDGYAQGTISGFGSIFVNGVRYDDSGAAVLDGDGNAHTRDDLRLGMTVAVDSDSVVNAGATARRIQYASEIVGVVAGVDGAAGVLTVLGQTVQADALTVFDDRLPGGLAALAAGQWVEVYGFVDSATGRYRATRIEPHAVDVSARLRGIVAQISGSSLRIGAAWFDAGALPAGTAVGGYVRMSLQPAAASATRFAVLSFSTATPALPEGREVDLRGLISSFTSATRFSVNGLPVDASAARFPDGSAGLAAGVRVEVDGTVVGGVVKATEVKIESDDEEGGSGYELEGSITAIDTTARTFVLRSVIVSYGDGGVVFKDGTAADLKVGARVKVKGALSSDGTQVVATEIEIDN